jgi:transcriptional regulator with XRE-family HTH domain
MGTSVKKLVARWMKDPEFKKGYDALEEEFALAELFINARVKAKLSQAQLAKRMQTTQSTIARLESGKARPTIATLKKFAKATGMEVHITFVPKKRTRAA